MTQSQRNAITPAEGLIIYNTTTKKPNYFDGTEWKNFDGSSAIAIGDTYQGGVVAYIFIQGDPGFVAGETHGLIAAPTDQGTVVWGCYNVDIPGANNNALGAGNQNTIDIMAGCATAGIAARICGDLVLNGYSDWFLPSYNELNKLYVNRQAIGGFNVNWPYWSSSEYNSQTAWAQDFSNGGIGPYSKTLNPLNVRAIRAF